MLTVTARDAAGNLGTDVLTVTYTPPPDTTLPVATITVPTSAATFATTTTPLATLSGTASDNVGVTQVSWANDRGGSGTADWHDELECEQRVALDRGERAHGDGAGCGGEPRHRCADGDLHATGPEQWARRGLRVQ